MLALLLGLCMLLSGGLGLLVFQYNGLSAGEALAPDWQDTQAFRDAVSRRMNGLLEVAGEMDTLYREGDGTYQNLDIHWRPDKNLLYCIQLPVPGGTLVQDNGGAAVASSGALPEGYSFWMKYRDGQVVAWKDGEALDLYGDGFYRPGESRWDLPGYDNRAAADVPEGAVITLAAAARPVQWDSVQGELYHLYQSLSTARTACLACIALLTAGAGLLVWAFCWRRYRRPAWQAAARWTGRIWLEIKVLGLLGLLLADLSYQPFRLLTACLTPVWAALLVNELRQRGREIRHPSAFQRWGGLAGFTGRIPLEVKLAGLAPLAFCWTWAAEGAWMLNYLSLNPSYLVLLALALWLTWAYVNDLSRNRAAVFANSLCRRLADHVQRRLLTYPAQIRLERAARGALLTHVPFLVLLALGELALCWIYLRYSDLFTALLMALLGLLACCILALPACAAWRYYRRQRACAADLGVLLDQIGAMARGEQNPGGALSPASDLAQAAEDLGRIRQGVEQAVAERMKSERLKVELIANVSHDLKTPLTSILSYAALLRQEELPGAAGDYARILDEKAQRLKAMVGEVFEVSKAASGALEVKLERLDLRRLLEQTLADMAEPMAASALTFRTNLPPAPVYITGDGDRLYRVFQNLLQNALQYALEGTRVYLRVTVEEGWAQVSLRNTAREELPQGVDFTERFVRGDASRTGGGSGLGLAIASTFVQACGGRFAVETEDDRFTARTWLPLA